MSTLSVPSRPAVASTGPRRQLGPPSAWLTLGAVALAAAVLALSAHAHHPQALPRVLLISAGVLVLFVVCGDALSQVLVPASWREVRLAIALLLGAAASGMVLMAFGYCHVPLHVSLWLTLALGLFASWWVRRSSAREAREELGEFRAASVVWAGVGLLLFLAALIPAWRTEDLTVYGQNPDSSQVVGIAVLFQHVPPTHMDIALPLDVVPQEWRFRYPIFYPLAAVANLVHADPIRVFPVIVALLLVLAAVGYGMVAVSCFRAPKWAGPVIAAMIGFTWILQYLAWHPYWNQLWGTALMPFTILFGTHALEHRDPRAGIACGFLLLALWFAYPLALPYPLVILAAMLVVHWRRPRRPTISGWRGWLAALALLVLLTPAVLGSVLKLKEALLQLLSPHSELWGGDIKQYVSFGRFAGTGGGWVPGLLVLLAAAYGLWRLPRRLALGLGVVLAALVALDLRFRLTPSGTYMDFKHLCFVGLLVLSLAAAGLLARVARPGVGRWLAALAVLVWCGAALELDHADAITQNAQVTPQMFDIRHWAAALPAHASVRVDIPPRWGGMQLWAVYMLNSHPVDSFEPLLDTTYAHAVPGYRADYALSVSVSPVTFKPYPAAGFTAATPVFSNDAYVLRKVLWPKRYAGVPRTASQYLEP